MSVAEALAELAVIELKAFARSLSAELPPRSPLQFAKRLAELECCHCLSTELLEHLANRRSLQRSWPYGIVPHGQQSCQKRREPALDLLLS
jgi:hypothetical protein